MGGPGASDVSGPYTGDGGKGGDSFLGIGAPQNETGVGESGTGYGAGGGGGHDQALAGGAGTDGVVIVTEYFN